MGSFREKRTKQNFKLNKMVRNTNIQKILMCSRTSNTIYKFQIHLKILYKKRDQDTVRDLSGKEKSCHLMEKQLCRTQNFRQIWRSGTIVLGCMRKKTKAEKENGLLSPGSQFQTENTKA